MSLSSVSRTLEITLGDGDRAADGSANAFSASVQVVDLVDIQLPGYEEGETSYRDASTGRRVRRTQDWTLTDPVFTIRGYHSELVQATGVRVAGGAAAVASNARAGAAVPVFDAFELFEDDETGAARLVRHNCTGRIHNRSRPNLTEGGLSVMSFTVRV